MQVKGTLVASPDMSNWNESNRRYWIVVRGVDGLAVGGGGTIDGNGEGWWENSCKINRALVSVLTVLIKKLNSSSNRYELAFLARR
jgi:hypothetical protein